MRAMLQCRAKPGDRTEAGRWMVFQGGMATPAAATDDERVGLRGQRVGDMRDERATFVQRQCLVRAEAAGAAAREDGAQDAGAAQAVSSNSSRPIR